MLLGLELFRKGLGPRKGLCYFFSSLYGFKVDAHQAHGLVQIFHLDVRRGVQEPHLFHPGFVEKRRSGKELDVGIGDIADQNLLHGPGFKFVG